VALVRELNGVREIVDDIASEAADVLGEIALVVRR
jgi:hypothetical protein